MHSIKAWYFMIKKEFKKEMFTCNRETAEIMMISSFYDGFFYSFSILFIDVLNMKNKNSVFAYVFAFQYI